MKFVKESTFAAPAEVVFAFHELPDAFERLQPPWQKVEILQHPSSLEVGTVVRLRVGMPPFGFPSQEIVAEHVAYEPGRSFTDRMVKGPFRQWLHHHLVEPVGPSSAQLVDDVTYELPLPPLGRWFGGWFARRQLERLFTYRHQVTRAWCEAQNTD